MAINLSGKSTKVLMEERATLVANARSFVTENENSWDATKEASYDAMMKDASDYTAAIKRRDQLASLDASQSEGTRIPQQDPNARPGSRATEKPSTVMIRDGYDASGKPHYHEVPVGKRGDEAYNTAFTRYLSGGSLNPEERAALQSDDPAQAGYLVASEQLAAGILKQVDDFTFVRRYAKIHTLPEAGSLGIRRRNTRANTFGWTTELEIAAEDTALAYGKKVLTPHPLTGLIKVSRDLVRRSMGGAVSEVMYELGRDAAEKMEDAYFTGNGAQRPLGVFTASSDGISTARDVQTGSSTSITADGLIDAKYALKAQYRNEQLGPVRWLFHRDAIKIIAKLKDSQNQYLWQPGLQAGQPDRLLNLPLDESERAPNTFTTGLYVGLLANWRYYEIADALDMEMQVVTELYAATNQFGYIGRLKTDGMPTLEEAFVRLKTN